MSVHALQRRCNVAVALEALTHTLPYTFTLLSPFLLTKRVRILDMQILIIARSHGMDARGWSLVSPISSCTTTRRMALGTWVYVSFALPLHPPPSLIRQTPHALRMRVHAHTHAHTITYADQRRTRRQGRIVHPAQRERDRVRLANATAKSTRRLPIHLPARRAEGVDLHGGCALRHGAELGRSTFATVKDEGDGAQHGRVVEPSRLIIHTQKLRLVGQQLRKRLQRCRQRTQRPSQPYPKEESRRRDQHVGETFVVSARGSHQTKQVIDSVSFFLFDFI